MGDDRWLGAKRASGRWLAAEVAEEFRPLSEKDGKNAEHTNPQEPLFRKKVSGG